MPELETITKWQEASQGLDYYKKLEATLRRKICEEIFKDRTGKFSTTEKLQFDTYYLRIKASSVTSLKVDEEMLVHLHQDGLLTELDNNCFERKLHIKDGALRKIPTSSHVWRAITEKPGMPKLEVTKHEN
jgi:hypothetical protein